MDYRANYRGMGKFLVGADARKVCTLAGGRVLAKARVLASDRSVYPQATGKTAATGRLVHGRGGRKNDRVKVSVVFGGEAVAMQFGNKRRRAGRFLTRAAE
jgi:hypothetical protein